MLIDFEKLAQDFVSNKICTVSSKKDVSLDEQKYIIAQLASKIGFNSDNFLTIEGMNHQNLDMNFKNEGFYSKFFQSRMHVDLPRAKGGNQIAFLISMCMKVFECAKPDGNTYFLNMQDVLKKLSFNTKDLSDIKISFVHDDHRYVSPVIFTHEIFNEDTLFWPTSNVELFSGEPELFAAIKGEVQEVMSNYSNWYEHKWSANDMVIFDNSSMLHSFTPGWTKDQRIFNQVCSNCITPTYLSKNIDIWKDWNDSTCLISNR